MRIASINAEEIKRRTDFYLDLGYSRDIAEYLGKHTFSEEELTSEELEKQYKEFHETYRKCSAGGLHIGTSSSIIRAASYSANVGQPTLDKLDNSDASDASNASGASGTGGGTYISLQSMAPNIQVQSDRACKGLFMSSTPCTSCIDNTDELLDKTFGRFDRFNDIKEQGFHDALNTPTSTFGTTVNTASMNIIRTKLYTGMSQAKSSVRTEELLNFFDYNIPAPSDGNKFSIKAELVKRPDSDNQYMFIGIRGEKQKAGKQNIVFLLDASGSMRVNASDMQKSLFTVLKQLNPDDTVSIITYTSRDKVVITGAKASEIDKIIKATSEITIQGATNGSAGLDMAYKTADKYFIKNGNNRVIMMTDGDFNFGRYTMDDIKQLAESKRDSGVFLTLLGFGRYNYDDSKMEALAKSGNGVYFKIMDDADIIETLKDKINSTLVTIAKDVKVQVEFNPSKVLKYRLIGYENRALSHEDFTDDKVHTETVGSGHTVIAMYELKYNDTTDNEPESRKLKYQASQVIESDDICTISLRYKQPNSDESEEIQSVVTLNDAVVKSNNTSIAMAVITLADRLRGSENYTKGDTNQALEMIKGIKGRKVEILRNLLEKA